MGLPDTADEKKWMERESKISGDPDCDRYGNLYRTTKPQKRQACPECWNMMSGRCDDCGRNIFGDNEYMDWEL